MKIRMHQQYGEKGSSKKSRPQVNSELGRDSRRKPGKSCYIARIQRRKGRSIKGSKKEKAAARKRGEKNKK